MGMTACRGSHWLVWAALLVCGAVNGRLCAQTDGDIRLAFATGNTGAHVRSSPALDADGILYVGVSFNKSGRLLAIDPDAKTVKAGWPAAGFVTPETVESSPAIGPDGTIYFSCYDGYLYALRKENGALKWKRRIGVYSTSSPAIRIEGASAVIYIGSTGVSGDGSSGDNGLHAFSPDGTQLWTFRTKDGVESSPAIGPDGTIFFGSSDNSINAVNPDGTLKWSKFTASSVVSSPAIGADGTVYVGSYDGYFYALLPERGEVKWRFQVDDVIHSSPALGPDGTVYFGALNKNFYALNPADGSLRWSPISTGGLIFSSPAVRSDGVVIFGSDDGVVRALYEEDGRTKWAKFLSAEYVESSPVIAKDGSVYVGSTDGKLYGFFGSGAVASTYSRWPMFRRGEAHAGAAPVAAVGGRLVNLSTRAQAGDGNTLIAGLVAGGAGAKNYLIRGVGPSLAELFSVPNPLSDPALTIRSNGSNVALFANDDWGLANNVARIRLAFAAVGAFPLGEGSKDAAVLGLLEAGLYTAVLSGATGDTGIALIEAYDADPNTSGARLINLSTRAQVGRADDQSLIAGLVVGGTAPVRLLVRGVGPGLAGFGVNGILARPELKVFSGASVVLTNVGWTSSVLRGDMAGAAKVVGAFPLAAESADCAAIVTLQPGAYTIQISGVNGSAGEALVEVYLLP